MLLIPFGEFRKLTVDEIKKSAPFVVTAQGEPFGFFATAADFIFVGDLHPRVRNNLRAQENLARMGMPKLEPVLAEYVRNEQKKESPVQ